MTALFFCSPDMVHAVPADPTVRTLLQADGTILRVRQWGDERSHGFETDAGDTLVFDDGLNRWTYADRGTDGTLKSSKLVPGKDDPSPRARGLRPLRSGAEKKTTREERRELSPGASSGATSRTSLLRQSVPPSTGNGNIPVLLITFNGKAASTTAQQFEDLFFTDGNDGVRDYYREVSYNAFTVSSGPGGVQGWLTAAQGHDYYGTNDTYGDDLYPGTLVGEAVQAADATFDFAPYDQDGDCSVDIVSVIYQGTAESSGGPSTDIWPHRWNLASARTYRYSISGVYDGPGEYTTNDICLADPTAMVTINDYTVQSEILDGSITTIGTFTHEYGHALGLPDLYDTDGSSEGAGRWSLMASGSWNTTVRSGDSPAHLDPWSKFELGWVTPTVVSGTLADETVAQAATDADVYQLLAGTPSSGEYFLVENRQKTGFDAGLPGAGLLVWHIDAGVSTNRNECYPGGPSCNAQHYKVAVVQADNLHDLEQGTDRGDDGDPYPGTTGNRAFSASSAPDSDLYSGDLSNISVTAISDAGAAMTATLSAISVPPPPLADALDQPEWVFTTSGSASWSGQTAMTHDGVDAARAGGIGDGQSMRVETTQSFAAGSVRFWWQVSSESNFDHLRFYLDGVEKNAISGEVGWTQQSWPVSAGSHTLAWEYTKDYSISSGSDRAWVDQLETGPALCTLTVASTNPTSGASVQVNPADVNGLGNGRTQFTRTFTCGTPVTLTAPAAAGGQAFQGWNGCAVVDGATCTLTVDADRAVTADFLGQSLCVAAQEITVGVGQAYRNDGAGSTSAVDTYSCVSSWDESGPEYTYTFTAPRAAAYTATLSGLYADLDVFVLDKDQGCVGGSCISYGNSQATWTGEAGHQYFIVVDGYQGAVSDYTLLVTSANATPTDITLSAASVDERRPAGTAIGTFSTADPDAGDAFTYSLVTGTGGTDNGSFTVAGDVLQTAAVFSAYEKSVYGIRVRATDRGGLWTEKSFTIAVVRVRQVDNDFDGDGRSDIGCYYPPGGLWYGFDSTDGFWQAQFGYPGTVPVTGDFDGDGLADFGCYHAADGTWHLMVSSEGLRQAQFGYAGTIPVVGDFDGDGRDDIGCYYPDAGNWYFFQSTEGFRQTTFGYAGTTPVVGDFDGDGRDDIGCYYPAGGNWYLFQSTEGFRQAQFGYTGTIPVVGDFDGDGRDDIGCHYPAGGNWYLFQSTEGFRQAQFGSTGTEPVVGDFDGDGRDDLGSYYPDGGNWSILKSQEGLWQTVFGYAGTIPLGGTNR